MLKEPELFSDCLESIVVGIHMELLSKALLSMKWEELWDRDLDDWALCQLAHIGGEAGLRLFTQNICRGRLKHNLELFIWRTSISILKTSQTTRYCGLMSKQAAILAIWQKTS